MTVDNKKIVDTIICLFYDAVNADFGGDDSELQASYLNENEELGGVTTSIEDGKLIVYINTDKRIIVTVDVEEIAK